MRIEMHRKIPDQDYYVSFSEPKKSNDTIFSPIAVKEIDNVYYYLRAKKRGNDFMDIVLLESLDKVTWKGFVVKSYPTNIGTSEFMKYADVTLFPEKFHVFKRGESLTIVCGSNLFFTDNDKRVWSEMRLAEGLNNEIKGIELDQNTGDILLNINRELRKINLAAGIDSVMFTGVSDFFFNSDQHFVIIGEEILSHVRGTREWSKMKFIPSQYSTYKTFDRSVIYEVHYRGVRISTDNGLTFRPLFQNDTIAVRTVYKSNGIVFFIGDLRESFRTDLYLIRDSTSITLMPTKNVVDNLQVSANAGSYGDESRYAKRLWFYADQKEPKTRRYFEGEVFPFDSSVRVSAVKSYGNKIDVHLAKNLKHEERISVWMTNELFVRRQSYIFMDSVGKSDNGMVSLKLNPQDAGVDPGEKGFVKIEITGSGFKRIYILEPFVFDRFWFVREHFVAVVIGGLFILYVLALLLVFWLHPLYVLRMNNGFISLLKLDLIPGPLGKIVKVLNEITIMPFLVRRNRVLDQWVSTHKETVVTFYRNQKLVKASKQYSPFPITVNGDEIEKPTPESFAAIFKTSKCYIEITGIGGTGKTTLAIELSKWLYEDLTTIQGYTSLPVLMHNFTQEHPVYLKEYFKDCLGEEIPEYLLSALLRNKRLTLVADAVSELPESQQDRVKTLGLNRGIGNFIVTSRHVQLAGNKVDVQPSLIVTGKLLKPTSILIESKGEQTLTDIDQALLSVKVAQLFDPKQIQLDVTLLLLNIVIDKAISLHRTGEKEFVEKIPNTIGEILLDYINIVHPQNRNAPNWMAPEPYKKVCEIIASVLLGDNFIPKDVARTELAEPLKAYSDSIDPVQRLIDNGILLDKSFKKVQVVRFRYDTLNEFLGAQYHASQCGKDKKKWEDFIDRCIEMKDTAPGFFKIMNTVYREYRGIYGWPDIDKRTDFSYDADAPDLTRTETKEQPHELITKDCLVRLYIESNTGERVRYVKTQNLVAVKDGLDRIVDSVSADAEVTDISSATGTIAGHRKESGLQLTTTRFPNPLKKGEQFVHEFSCNFINSFNMVEEYWEQKQFYPAEQFVVEVFFPVDRPPKFWEAQEKIGANYYSSHFEPQRVEVDGIVKLSLTVTSPRLDKSYMLKWVW